MYVSGENSNNYSFNLCKDCRIKTICATYKLCNQELFYHSFSPSWCFCTTWRNRKHGNHTLSPILSSWQVLIFSAASTRCQATWKPVLAQIAMVKMPQNEKDVDCNYCIGLLARYWPYSHRKSLTVHVLPYNSMSFAVRFFMVANSPGSV